MAQQGFDIECGPWTELETITLIVILEIFQESPLLPNALNASSIYRHLASSSIIENSGLTIGQKRNAQVAGKILHMQKNLALHVQMLEKECDSNE